MRFAASLIALISLSSIPAVAQQFELPRASPNAKVMQTAGLTDISVEYSSPGVGGRVIWGKLLPYGEVWRAGANATTKLTFSRGVEIGGTKIPAGSYAFFVIPNASGPWTLILNKDYEQGGASNYKKELDVVRVEAAPETIPNRERLAYAVTNFNDDKAQLDLEWEKVRVSLPIKLMTDAQVAAQAQTLDAGGYYAALADYERLNRKDYDKGLQYVEKSIKMGGETWQNLWAKSRLLAAKGQYKDAVKTLKKAQTLGSKAPPFFATETEKNLKEWEGK
jgi:tetratricopeptide (TPR) repeat protein